MLKVFCLKYFRTWTWDSQSLEQLSRQVAGKEDRKKFKQIIRKKTNFFGRWEKIRLSLFLGLKGLGHEMN